MILANCDGDQPMLLDSMIRNILTLISSGMRPCKQAWKYNHIMGKGT